MEKRLSCPAQRRVLLCCIGAFLLLAYYPLFSWMVARFMEEESYYSHGFLLPFVVVYLLRQKRTALRQLPVSSSGAGLWLLVAGLLLHLGAGILLNIGFASGISFVAALLGISLYLFGREITKVVLYPLLLVLLMVPVPKVVLIALTFKMKMMAAHAAVAIAGWMHIAVHRAGSVLYLPNGILTVENECSGINSLISLFTLSVIFACGMEGRWHNKALLVLLSLPIALAANITRIVFLVLAAFVYGVEAAANGILHYGAGIALWGTALVMFTVAWRAMEWRQAR